MAAMSAEELMVRNWMDSQNPPITIRQTVRRLHNRDDEPICRVENWPTTWLASIQPQKTPEELMKRIIELALPVIKSATPVITCTLGAYAERGAFEILDHYKDKGDRDKFNAMIMANTLTQFAKRIVERLDDSELKKRYFEKGG